MKAPCFSIVIPTCNRERQVVAAIQSVLGQTFQNFEVVVVDDGSTDSTSDVVRSITNPRIKYFRKQNEERASARNFGVAHAEGKYVTFLDSDDLLKENHLEEAQKFIFGHPDASVFHLGYDVVDSRGQIKHPWKALPSPANHKLLEGNFLSCLGVFLKSEVVKANQFNTDRRLTGSEDYELWMRLAARYPIYTVPKSTAQLVDHSERSVVRIDPVRFAERIKLFKHYVLEDDPVRSYYGSQLKILFAFMEVYAALHFQLALHKRESAKALCRAVKLYPAVLFNYRFWVVVKKHVYH